MLYRLYKNAGGKILIYGALKTTATNQVLFAPSSASKKIVICHINTSLYTIPNGIIALNFGGLNANVFYYWNSKDVTSGNTVPHFIAMNAPIIGGVGQSVYYTVSNACTIIVGYMEI